MKKAIIIIVAVLVVLGGTFAGLFFFTDLFNFMKPASDNFSIQAKKLFGAKKETSYEDYLKSIESFKIGNTSFTTDTEISAKVSLPSNILDYATQKTLNSTSLKMKGSFDVDSKATAYDIGLYSNGSESLKLSALSKGHSISIGCNDVYDKTLTFDLDKYKTFCDNIGATYDEASVNSIKKTIDQLNNQQSNNILYDLFYLTEDEYKALDKNYGNLLVDLIDKENYTSKKNQKVTVCGDEVKTTAYSLTLDGSDAYNFIEKLVKLSKDDDNLKTILVNKYDILTKYIQTLSTTDNKTSADLEIPKLEKSNFEEVMNKILDALNSEKDSFSELKKAIKLTIYSNKKNNPVKFEVAILKDSDDKDGKVILSEELGNGKNIWTIDIENISSELSGSTASSVSSTASALGKIVITDKYEKNDDSRKGTLTISQKGSENSTDLLNIDYEFVNSKSEIKQSITVTSNLLSVLSFNYTFNVTGLDTDTQKTELALNGKYSMYSVELNAKGSTTKGKSDIPDLSNAVDVFSLSKEDLQTLLPTISNNISTNLPAKLQSLGINLPKEAITSSSMLPSSATTTQPTTVNPSNLTEEQKAMLNQAAANAQNQLNSAAANGTLTPEQQQQAQQALNQAQSMLQSIH